MFCRTVWVIGINCTIKCFLNKVCQLLIACRPVFSILSSIPHLFYHCQHTSACGWPKCVRMGLSLSWATFKDPSNTNAARPKFYLDAPLHPGDKIVPLARSVSCQVHDEEKPRCIAEREEILPSQKVGQNKMPVRVRELTSLLLSALGYFRYQVPLGTFVPQRRVFCCNAC